MLLDAGHLSVTDVGLATGFSDGGYFGHVFQKEVGITPGAYPSRLAKRHGRNSSNRATRKFLSYKTDAKQAVVK